MCSVLVTAPVIFSRFTNITDIKKKQQQQQQNKAKQNSCFIECKNRLQF